MSKEMVALDQIDRKIIKALQDNARLSSQELSERVGISTSPCWRRVKALEDAGVITRYVTLVDPEALGLSISIFTNVSLDKQVETALETFQKAVRKRPEVMECYLMTGDFDYLLRVVVGSLHDYERFLLDHLTKIPGVASIKSSFALKQVKYTTALPVS
jgi:Lrp/AsnC family transcriptional regulator, leucine-responsive regulatory protein